MSLSTPTCNRGLVKKSTGSAVVSEVAIPKLRDGYMLVKTAAVALNPADWTDIDYEGAYEGCLVGLDYAGTVISTSAWGPTERTFKKGDRVCGLVPAAILPTLKMAHSLSISSSRLACKCIFRTI